MKLSNRLLTTKTNDRKIDKNLKIDLLECSNGGDTCKNQLAEINKSYNASIYHQYEKNYLESINILINAYEKTKELKQHSCIRCTAFFRSTIIESLKVIHTELQKMSSGVLRNKRYQEIYETADNILKNWQQEQY